MATDKIDTYRLKHRFLVQNEFSYSIVELTTSLDLFMHYRTKGSVSKVKVRFGFPPRIDVKLVDDRYCLIWHSADMHFRVDAVTSIGEVDMSASHTFEINKYSDIATRVLAGLISNMPAGIFAQLGFGSTFRCNGWLGRERRKAHREAYKDGFRTMAEGLHEELKDWLEGIFSKAYGRELETILPLSFKLGTQASDQRIRQSIFRQLVGREAADSELDSLVPFSDSKILCKEVFNIARRENYGENFRSMIEERIRNEAGLADEIASLHRAVEEQRNRGAPPAAYSDDMSLDEYSSSSFFTDVIVARRCIMVPGYYGMMPEGPYPDFPDQSNRALGLMKELESSRRTTHQTLDKLLTVAQVGELLGVSADVTEPLISTYENAAEELAQIDKSIAVPLYQRQSYLRCTRTKAPHLAEDPYRHILHAILSGIRPRPQIDVDGLTDSENPFGTEGGFESFIEDVEVEETRSPLTYAEYLTNTARLDLEGHRGEIFDVATHIAIVRGETATLESPPPIHRERLDRVMDSPDEILKERISKMHEILKSSPAVAHNLTKEQEMD